MLFDKVREGNHAALAEALRADPRVVGWRDSLGYTPLHWAAAVDNDAEVRLLLDAGADPNARDLRGQTPLHIASMSHIRSGDVMIKTLIARGACVDVADARGVAPLQIARSVGRSDLAQALLAAGAAEPAKVKELPEAADSRVADAAPAPHSAPTPSPDLRPRRPRAIGPLRAWVRLYAVRPHPAALRGDG
jgi:ankyrin repeat protein